MSVLIVTQNIGAAAHTPGARQHASFSPLAWNLLQEADMDARQEDHNDRRHGNRQSSEAPADSHTIAGGIGASAVATLAMSGLMLGAQRAGLMHKQPPEKITERFLDELHVQRSESEQNAWSAIAHFGFGMACGGLFGTLRGRLLRAHPVSEGILFGTLVWAASYCGWIPVLAIMPPPTRDQPGRSITMLAAHIVFGAVLGGLTPRATARGPAAAAAALR